jgi:hypothetical protein
MKTIHLHIPDDLADKMQKLTNNVESFIIDLLRRNVTEPDKISLADQYKAAAKENGALLKDFSHIDLQDWDDDY